MGVALLLLLLLLLPRLCWACGGISWSERAVSLLGHSSRHSAIHSSGGSFANMLCDVCAATVPPDWVRHRGSGGGSDTTNFVPFERGSYHPNAH